MTIVVCMLSVSFSNTLAALISFDFRLLGGRKIFQIFLLGEGIDEVLFVSLRHYVTDIDTVQIQ